MIRNFILDVDGVLTDGRFYYTEQGKVMKAFGAHDSDGLKLIRDTINVFFISADQRGFGITQSRVADMGFTVELVSEKDRYDYVKSFVFEDTAFMGDGYHDAPVLRDCALGFAPANARPEAKEAADIVTAAAGGYGAVMDACLYLRDHWHAF